MGMKHMKKEALNLIMFMLELAWMYLKMFNAIHAWTFLFIKVVFKLIFFYDKKSSSQRQVQNNVIKKDGDQIAMENKRLD